MQLKYSMRTLSLHLLSVAFVFGSLLASGSEDDASPPSNSLPKVFQMVNERLAYGSEPRGKGDLQGLYDKGIRVVVSVDAARPLVEEAESLGMRIIHLPTPYSGFDVGTMGSFKRISMEVNEPIYVHCHHGKHRGPTAAAILAMYRGDFRNDKAIQLMKDAGTSPEYKGLWKTVEDFSSLKLTDPLPRLFKEQPADHVVEQMLIADESLDFILNYLAEGRPSEIAKDIPNHIVLLRESMVESRRFSDPKDTDLMNHYSQTDLLVRILEKEKDHSNSKAFEAATHNLGKSCKDCHQQHRN